MANFLSKSVLFVCAMLFVAPEAFAYVELSEVSVAGALAFAGSFSIIIRESLEAVVIIAAVVAALSSMGAKHFMKFVHIGWVGALVAGFATWWLSLRVLKFTDAQALAMEGANSVLAAAVLFYVSYRLVSKAQTGNGERYGKWKHYVDSRANGGAKIKSKLAIITAIFFTVYREAFETVLFYHALLVRTESSSTLVFWGLFSGTVVAGVLALAILKFSIRLPSRYVFTTASFILYALSFMLIGKGIHELQIAGVVSKTVAGFVPTVSLLGIYPTYETFLPQAVIAAVIAGFVAKVLFPPSHAAGKP
ncbi:MAG: FTR1 family iron permease [Thermodesulfobacteriota bacterium]